MNAYNLKIIAIIGMVANHMAIAWQEILPLWLMLPLYLVGGVTFPIMAFFAIEGYKYTSNIKKYLLRLTCFGVIAIPFHYLTFGTFTLNILFQIVWGFLIIMMYDKIKSKPLFYLLFVIALIPTVFMDWYPMGIIVMLLYYTIKKESTRRIMPGIVAGIMWAALLGTTTLGMVAANSEGASQIFLDSLGLGRVGTWDVILASNTFIIGCIAGAFLVKGYNGERGKTTKWLFYIAYPLHLAVLGIVAFAMGWVSLPFTA